MKTLLIVDGADVCRAPIIEYTLRSALAGPGWLGSVAIASRGLTAQVGAAMCTAAADRLGVSPASVAFFTGHRAERLTPADVANAGLILTAERDQRSAIGALQRGAQVRTFTVKEARVLATLLREDVQAGVTPPPADLPALAAALQAIRGVIPVIEPAVKTSAFHWKREATDPLSMADGHELASLHRHTVEEARETALVLGTFLAEALRFEPVVAPPAPASLHWIRRA
ncbi:hypothetical protein QDR37_03420 [Amnibacterium sp. CER49]|uniref:hypothetical protein n=1 Tax=Amnibacterium sp. CER49 TaxID=3039161 RepID=UPI00244AE2E9|nr:hypothetical protein [Amnibacterium sp. CER49]MDH2442989.1 hypothetical protein [Amnibacterium sp. CER49]